MSPRRRGTALPRRAGPAVRGGRLSLAARAASGLRPPAWAARAAILAFGTAALGLATWGAGCASLSPLEPGACGNFVIDPNEDCDSHAQDGGTCAAPGEPNACRYVCVAGSDCPSGFGCGGDGVCRRAPAPERERLSVMGEPVSFPSLQGLKAADFDADGVSEIIAFEDEDALGRRPARVVAPHIEGDATVVPLPVSMTAVAIDKLAGDVTDDIAFADVGGVLLLRGTADLHGELAAYPSLVPPEGTRVRSVPMAVLPEQPGEELVSLVQAPSAETLSIVRQVGPFEQEVLVELAGDVDALAGDVVRARFDESLPCGALVMAFHDADRALLFWPCRSSPKGVVWNTQGSVEEVLLPAGEKIGRGLLVGDLDGDGHADLLLEGASRALFAAWGSGDGTLVSSIEGGEPGAAGPFTELSEVAGESPGLPLAAADLNADGPIDFVVPTGVLISNGGEYKAAYSNLGAPWTAAVAASLNGDDRVDVAAASADSLNLDFLNNAGAGVFNPFLVATEGGVAHLATADFDGDLLTDLAISETVDHGGRRESHVEIAYGAPFGPPFVPIEMASLDDVSAMYPARLPPPSAAYAMAGSDHLADLVVTSRSMESSTDRTFELRGDGSRVLTAPLSLASPGGAARPLALSTGIFGDPITDIVALAADIESGGLHLFRIESIYEIELDQTLPSDALPGGLHALSGGSFTAFHSGAQLAAGDLDGNGDAEAVVVAPAGDGPDGAAVVISDYDEESFRFKPRPAQPLSLRLGVDSKLWLRDVDGDDLLDAVIVGGSTESPGDLVILWNDGEGGLSVAEPQRVQLEGGITGAACVLARSGRGCQLYVTTKTGTYRGVARAHRELDMTAIEGLPGGVDVTAGDFDGDGVTDVAIASPSACLVYRRLPEIP